MGIDAQKYTEQATAIRAAQPVHDRTTAADMAEELYKREERMKFHADKVAGFEYALAEQEGKWTKLTDAIAAAEKLLPTRPTLKHDIAELKEKLVKCEEEGTDIKKYLTQQRNVLKGAKAALKPVSEKNPIGFDFEKFERLKADEKALSAVGL